MVRDLAHLRQAKGAEAERPKELLPVRPGWLQSRHVEHFPFWGLRPGSVGAVHTPQDLEKSPQHTSLTNLGCLLTLEYGDSNKFATDSSDSYTEYRPYHPLRCPQAMPGSESPLQPFGPPIGLSSCKSGSLSPAARGNLDLRKHSPQTASRPPLLPLGAARSSTCLPREQAYRCFRDTRRGSADDNCGGRRGLCRRSLLRCNSLSSVGICRCSHANRADATYTHAALHRTPVLGASVLPSTLLGEESLSCTQIL